MMESLEFEMELAKASTPREMRRDANRMYNPMMIRDLHEYAPMVPWLEYINNILTPEILVVKDTERVIVDEPGYLRNLTILLQKTPKEPSLTICSSERLLPVLVTSRKQLVRYKRIIAKNSQELPVIHLGGRSVLVWPVVSSPLLLETCMSRNISRRNPRGLWTKWSDTSEQKWRISLVK